jgi:ABC-type tungstate transport system permease subunit
MSDISDRSVATLKALEKVGAINLDVLLTRANEVQSALKDAGVELEPGDICYKFTMHIGPHFGDVVGVAAEVQRLGFAIERVQQR